MNANNTESEPTTPGPEPTQEPKPEAPPPPETEPLKEPDIGVQPTPPDPRMILWAAYFTLTALLFWRAYKTSGYFVLAVLLPDITRSLAAPLRAGMARPYVGPNFWAWLASDVALFLIPPAVYLWAATGRKGTALAFWALTLAVVGVGYPTLRGPALLDFYTGVHVTAFGTGFLVLVGRGAWKGSLRREEWILTGMGAVSLMTAVMGWLVGIPGWWGVQLMDGVGIASVAIAASLPLQPQNLKAEVLARLFKIAPRLGEPVDRSV